MLSSSRKEDKYRPLKFLPLAGFEMGQNQDTCRLPVEEHRCEVRPLRGLNFSADAEYGTTTLKGHS